MTAIAPLRTEPAPAVRLDGAAPACVVPITSDSRRRTRTLGVVLIDAGGARWQRTVDIERVATIAAAVAGTVVAQGLAWTALRRPGPRVERITMGPGGWVSFRGGDRPRLRGLRSRPEPPRPWWAVLLRAHRVGG